MGLLGLDCRSRREWWSLVWCDGCNWLEAEQDKVHVNQFHATLMHLMGMDHRKLTFEHNGLEERLTGPSEVSVVEGLLA